MGADNSSGYLMLLFTYTAQISLPRLYDMVSIYKCSTIVFEP
jgi:hypothetical protein